MLWAVMPAFAATDVGWRIVLEETSYMSENCGPFLSQGTVVRLLGVCCYGYSFLAESDEHPNEGVVEVGSG